MQDIGLIHADDSTILDWAAKEGCILLTHDVATIMRYAYERVEKGLAMPGVVEVIETAAIGSIIDDLELFVLCSQPEEYANSVLNDGPSIWSQQDIATLLYPALVDHYLRSQNLWSAKGKAIPRRLQTVNADFAKRVVDSFERVFADNSAKKVIDIAAEILNADGGFLFEGHRLEAPQSWRIE